MESSNVLYFNNIQFASLVFIRLLLRPEQFLYVLFTCLVTLFTFDKGYQSFNSFLDLKFQYTLSIKT
jgi:hypothetical protein